MRRCDSCQGTTHLASEDLSERFAQRKQWRARPSASWTDYRKAVSRVSTRERFQVEALDEVRWRSTGEHIVQIDLIGTPF